jgi:hypothetical protein
MRERASPGAQLFTGVGFWIVAWRLMPEPDWHLTVKIFAGFLAIVGMVLVIGAVTQSARRVGPWWQGLAGRLIAVGIAWMTIISAALHCGTPHILYEYPARLSVGTCLYVGWQGFVRVPAVGYGAWNGCATVAWISKSRPKADRR